MSNVCVVCYELAVVYYGGIATLTINPLCVVMPHTWCVNVMRCEAIRAPALVAEIQNGASLVCKI